MSTFEELNTALGSVELQNKVGIALRIVADKVSRSEDTGGGFDPALHTDRLIWAKAFLLEVDAIPTEALAHMQMLVASKRAETLADILATSDADVQTGVEEGVDLFASQGGPGP